MIRLSDVKVRLQYRWRVRQPRLKLEDGNLREKLGKVEAQILRETLQRYGTQSKAARHPGVAQDTIARKTKTVRPRRLILVSRVA